jgi:hypothetical protein
VLVQELCQDDINNLLWQLAGLVNDVLKEFRHADLNILCLLRAVSTRKVVEIAPISIDAA